MKLFIRCKKLFESRLKILDIIRSYFTYQTSIKSFKKLIESHDSNEIHKDDYLDLTRSAKQIGETGFDIIGEIKSLSINNIKFIDSTCFVFKGMVNTHIINYIGHYAVDKVLNGNNQEGSCYIQSPRG